MSDPRVAGLILNYRDARRTLKCLSSLRAEGVVNVLIWDNSEDCGESASEIRSRLAEFPEAEIVVAPQNLGFAAGVNDGMAHIANSFPAVPVLLINNDAVLRHGAVAHLMSALRDSPQAEVFYPTINHAGTQLGTVHYHRWLGLITKREFPGSFAYASGCCILVNTAVRKNCLFERRYFMYGEDILLGFQLRNKNGAMVHVPTPLVDHEVSASSGKSTLFYERQMIIAHFYLSHDLARGRVEAAALAMARIPILLCRAICRCVRYRTWVPFQGLWQGVLHVVRELA